MPVKKSLLPTRKWLATALVLFSGILISGVESGFDDAEVTAAIGAVVTLGTAYLVPNKTTSAGDGVPSVGTGV